MADTIKSSDELKLVFAFYDNDDRTVTWDNPRENLTKADILEVANFAKDNNVVIGDKGGADCVGIKSAKILEKTVYKLDLAL